MEGKEFIVEGAICKCKFGSTPAKIKVLENDYFRINGTKLGATTQTLGNVFEVPGFGKCSIGTPSKPCVPAIVQWTDFYNGIKTSYGGQLLTNASKGTCSCGCPDCIEFITTGQIPVPGLKQLEEATAEQQGELDCMGEPSALSEYSVDEIVMVSPA